ncbi:hypothetical protein AGMMS50218_15220 [Actinomycetota bacterium]|nr:hypothetical protein AGMMS50218_15220 [Actinomycetota bacterium]
MTDDQSAGTGRGAGSGGRLWWAGAFGLVVCAGVVGAALWVLVGPGLAPAGRPSTTASPAPTLAPSSAAVPGQGPSWAPPGPGELPGEPDASGHGDAGSEVAVAQGWVRTLVGWEPTERDSGGARERARAQAPGAMVEIVPTAVLDYAAALAAGAPRANEVTVVDVTDPQVWTPGWVVLEVTVTTAPAPEAGVLGVVLHVVCEVEVTGGEVTYALVGDGAAWVE